MKLTYNIKSNFKADQTIAYLTDPDFLGRYLKGIDGCYIEVGNIGSSGVSLKFIPDPTLNSDAVPTKYTLDLYKSPTDALFSFEGNAYKAVASVALKEHKHVTKLSITMKVSFKNTINGTIKKEDFKEFFKKAYVRLGAGLVTL